MKTNKNPITKGFTLIEVLVTLGIIGMLIILVLIGVSNAQSAQRDTARKVVATQVNAGIKQFQVDTGAPPTYANFIGSGSSYFIDQSISCTNGFAINEKCISDEGLILEVSLLPGCGSLPPSFGPKRVSICYDPNTGSDGYSLYVWLDNKTAFAIDN